MLPSVATLLCASTILSGAWARPASHRGPCQVEARVRAEDLYPNAIINGDLRIKVQPSCTEEIESVSLQLQFDEFSQAKFLKKGAVLPSPSDGSTNRSSSMMCEDEPMDPQIVKYFEALDDPELWVVSAEERIVWMTSKNLIGRLVDYSRPHVVPFGVAIPNVNFPPGTGRSGFSSYLGSVHEAGSQHHYLYIAVVTFAGGRIVKVPAGFTTFLPTPADLPPATPFVSNITFKEDNCNQGIDWPSMQLPVFRAQASLEGGNVVRQGDRVKGRVVIDRMTSGSSTVQSISASFRSERDDRWAKAQATSGGDTTTFTSGTCFPSSFEERSYSCHHSFIFRDDNGCGTRGILDPAFVSLPRVNTLNEEKPYLDFELNVGENMVRDFRTYYATYETYLQIELGILYAPDVGHCMFGEMDGEPLIDDTDDMDLVEEGLWDDGTPVGMAKRSQRLGPSNYLVAKIPITLLGAHHPAALPTSSAPIHYLTPGVASPLILTPPFPPIEHIKFPQSQPVIIHVPVDNIIQRLPLSASATEGVWNSIVDPNRNYYSMPYTGLLWRKKIEHADRTGPVAGEEGKERQVNFSI